MAASLNDQINEIMASECPNTTVTESRHFAKQLSARHGLIATTTHSWRNWFRKRRYWRCWYCDLRVEMVDAEWV